MEEHRTMLSQKDFVRTARERCIDIEKHIQTFEMIYLEFAQKHYKYEKMEDEAAKAGGELRLNPQESEDVRFLEANMKRTEDVLSNYKNMMAIHRQLIMSSEILGDKAFYTIGGSGDLGLILASRKELDDHRNYMNEVDKCYQ